MEVLKKLSLIERFVILGCLLALFFSLFILYNSQEFIFNRKQAVTEEIGLITRLDNDTRHRMQNNLVWYRARDKQTIHMGDSLFTGEKSGARVKLNKGSEIEIGENALVVFNMFDNEQYTDMEQGNFRIQVNGNIKVMVKGEWLSIDGENSDLEIVAKKNDKPRIKLIKGEVKLRKGGELVTLNEEQAEIPERLEAKLLPPAEIPNLLPQVKEVHYNWRFDDIYRQEGYQLVNRRESPRLVTRPTDLAWSVTKTKKARVEFTNQPLFGEKQVFLGDSGKVTVNRVYMGENYWRVSFDGNHWSEIEQFTVTPIYNIKTQPLISNSESDVPFISDKVNAELRLKIAEGYDKNEMLGFVVQASTTPEFVDSTTHTFWSHDPTVRITFYRPGFYFYRFQSVSQERELSVWSETRRFKVFRPLRPSAPQLLLSDRSEGFVGDNFNLQYQTSFENHILVQDEKGKLVDAFQSKVAVWVPQAPGHYMVRAFAENKYGQKSQMSRPLILAVAAKPPPPKPILAERQPTATEKMKIRESEARSVYQNGNFKKSQVSLDGFMWRIQSTEQIYAGQAAPIATGAGVHTMQWWGAHGLEASVKSGVFGLNSTGAKTSLTDAEGRYHYRINTSFPFGWFSELQTSIFAGYEVYHNSNAAFASQYELVKFGTSVEFPLGARWSTGGEVVYGTGGGDKEEISGNINYFTKDRWVIGAGYRVHLFSAGSASSSPTGLLPYHEGYTELFTLFGYCF